MVTPDESSSTNGVSMHFLLIVVFYGLIIVISLCGNVLVCYVVVTKTSGNLTNYLIANLAFSDVLMTLLNIPITVIDILLGEWIFGQTLCLMVPFIQALCVYVSSFSMLTIALNRHHLVYRKRSPPKQSRRANRLAQPFASNVSNCSQMMPKLRDPKRCSSMPGDVPLVQLNVKHDHKCCNIRRSVHRVGTCLRPSKLSISIVLIWLFASLHSLPFMWNNKLIVLPRENVTKCLFLAKPPLSELALTLFVFTTQYLVPLVISAVIYIRIGITIVRLGQVTRNYHQSLASPTAEACGEMEPARRTKLISRHKRRRICLLTLIVVLFALTWFPFHFYYLLKDFDLIKPNNRVFLFTHWFAMSSAMVNPFVYFWLNDNFHSDIERIIQNVFNKPGIKASQVNSSKVHKVNQTQVEVNHNIQINLASCNASERE